MFRRIDWNFQVFDQDLSFIPNRSSNIPVIYPSQGMMNVPQFFPTVSMSASSDFMTTSPSSSSSLSSSPSLGGTLKLHTPSDSVIKSTCEKDDLAAALITLLPPPQRILKADIRRQYGRMFTNVMNSGDINLLSSFFDRFGSRNLSLCKRNQMPMGIPFACDRIGIDLQGKDMIVGYWVGLMNLTPDHSMRIEDVKIKTKAGESGSRLEFNFQIKGTKMYRDFHPGHIAKNVIDQFQSFSKSKGSGQSQDQKTKKVVGTKRSITSGYATEEVTTKNDGVLEFPCQVYDPLQAFRDASGKLPPPNPSRIEVSGLFTIHINDHKKIEKFEIVGLCGSCS